MRRLFSTAVGESNKIYLSSIFPIRYGRFDPRYAYSLMREHSILDYLRTRMNDSGVQVKSIDSRLREGGAFITVEDNASLSARTLRNQLIDNGSLRKVTLLNSAVYPVLGIPFNEDMDRYPSSQLKVDFEGEDVSQEDIYRLFRGYGRIVEIESIKNGAIITYQTTSASTAARSCLHGVMTSGTRLRISYQARVSKHFYKDWVVSHPRIIAPLLVFLLGAISYVIFDPVREYAIKSKIMQTFSLDSFKRKLLMFGDGSIKNGTESIIGSDIQDRKEASELASVWLNEFPSTFITVTGARGSGKSSLLKHITHDRQVLQIDCATICKAENDTQLVTALAMQTGYWWVAKRYCSINFILTISGQFLDF